MSYCPQCRAARVGVCVDILPSGCAARFFGASCPPLRSAPRVVVRICPASLKIPSVRARPPISCRPPQCSLHLAQPWSASHCRRLNRRNRNIRLHPQRGSTSSLLNMLRLNMLHRNTHRRNTPRRSTPRLNTFRLNMARLNTLRLNMFRLSTHRLNMPRHPCSRRRERRAMSPERSAPAAIGTGRTAPRSWSRPAIPLMRSPFDLARPLKR